MSKILKVHVSSEKLQEEIENFVGKDSLYDDVSELVCTALRYFFDKEGYQSKEDTRKAFYVHELGDELKDELEAGLKNGYFDEGYSELDCLMKEDDKNCKK